jgi:hypothetical protein
MPRTLTLEGTGLFHNITGCHITSHEIEAFPELHGKTYASLDTPIFYLPDNISALNDHELKDIPLPKLQKLEDIYFRSHYGPGVDTAYNRNEY